MVSDGIGNINIAVCRFRPPRTRHDAPFEVPRRATVRCSNVTLYRHTILIMACRECEKKKWQSNNMLLNNNMLHRQWYCIQIIRV